MSSLEHIQMERMKERKGNGKGMRKKGAKGHGARDEDTALQKLSRV
jgi:hypothetical protein